MCGKKFKPTSGKHLYCGNRRIKESCSYKKNAESKIIYAKNYIRTEDDNRKAREYYHLNKYRIEENRRKNSKRLRLRFKILKRDNFTCQYCGRKSPNVKLHIDHFYPKSKGGKYIENNLITSCADCNIGKSDVILN